MDPYSCFGSEIRFRVLQDEIEEWQREHRRSDRIPSVLWNRLKLLVNEYGYKEVSQRLCFSIQIVKRWMRTQKYYKYCSFNDYSLAMLRDQKAWYSKLSAFNDPFDGDFAVRQEVTTEEYLQSVQCHRDEPHYAEKLAASLDDSTGQIPEDMRQRILRGCKRERKMLKEFGVLCLTKKRDHPLMWAHYADNHYGFNIEFKINRNEIPIRKVLYATVPARLPLSVIMDSIDGQFLDFQYVKQRDWKYEQEWRVTYLQGNYLGPLPGRISGINFGIRMKEHHKRIITKILSSYSCPVDFQNAVQRADSYNLDFEDYYESDAKL